MSKAIYPGSFDPITLGHLDIIRRILPQFSELVVVVANSQRKQYLFSIEERAELIRENLQGPEFSNVRVDTCDHLIADYAVANGAGLIVRGLRAVSDFEYEFAMANINTKLTPSIETLLIFTRPEFSFVASHMVKEVAANGGRIEAFVPPNVVVALKERLLKKAAKESR